MRGPYISDTVMSSIYPVRVYLEIQIVCDPVTRQDKYCKLLEIAKFFHNQEDACI